MKKECSVVGCLRDSRVKGLCNTHYERLRRNGSLVPKLVIRSSKQQTRVCVVNDFALVETSEPSVWAVIDFNYIEDVRSFKWTVLKSGYVRTWIDSKGLYLHELINGKAGKGNHTDHINRQKLDNRKSNLRRVPCAINARNSSTFDSSKGFCFKKHGRFAASMYVENWPFHLGVYDTAHEAAQARKEALAIYGQGTTREDFTKKWYATHPLQEQRGPYKRRKKKVPEGDLRAEITL